MQAVHVFGKMAQQKGSTRTPAGPEGRACALNIGS